MAIQFSRLLTWPLGEVDEVASLVPLDRPELVQRNVRARGNRGRVQVVQVDAKLIEGLAVGRLRSLARFGYTNKLRSQKANGFLAHVVRATRSAPWHQAAQAEFCFFWAFSCILPQVGYSFQHLWST